MRIPDITLKRKIDPGMQDFMDYTMFILNDGLYQFRVLNGVPGWAANDGECVLYSSGTTRALYFYVEGQWINITWQNVGNGGNSGPIADCVSQTCLASQNSLIRSFSASRASVG